MWIFVFSSLCTFHILFDKKAEIETNKQTWTSANWAVAVPAG